MAKLEHLLVLAVIVLVFQLWPQLGNILLYAIDFRNWPRTVWFIANAAIVVFLLGIRVGPDLLEDWQERRQRAVQEKSKQEKALRKKKEREAIERMQESQDRRIY